MMDVFRDKSKIERHTSEPSSAVQTKSSSRPEASLSAERLSQNVPESSSDALSRLVGRSPQMRQLQQLVVKIARCDSTVLIEGETGTGKELVARAIHQLSYRGSSRFLAHNCGATPDTLIESELFGHVKGAFTGAVQDKKGLFEVADGGTFFLDEIADISPMMQIKLLRVLQEREFRRVGETRSRHIDVRIVAATNRDLVKEVEEGRFRRDVYYRLGVIKLRLPTLRERREDIRVLAQHFLSLHARKAETRQVTLGEDAIRALINYDWPGNVRELENEIERAVALGYPSSEISLWVLSEAVRSGSSMLACDAGRAGTLKYETDRLERKRILEALESCLWNKTRAARMLGLSRQGLMKKMRRFRLAREES